MKKIKKYQIPIISILIIIGIFIGYILGKYTNTEAANTYQFQSNEIEFDGSAIGLSATNVKDAVDQIYQLYQSNAEKCPEGYVKIDKANGYSCVEIYKNFVAAYTYNAQTCLNGPGEGGDTGCVETTCYQSGTCPVGTIIDYNVKEGTTIRFHVLKDEGGTITMQAQKNTVYNTAWYATENKNSMGPQTIMAALKTATSDWSNVNPVTIDSGTTAFTHVAGVNNNNCSDTSCSAPSGNNGYTMDRIAGTYNARLITMQEATNRDIGGCMDSQKTCKAFMNNYLYQSNSNCGESSSLCKEDDYHTSGNHNYGYWTLGTNSSLAEYAWNVNYNGRITNSNTANVNHSARAVVNVTK